MALAIVLLPLFAATYVGIFSGSIKVKPAQFITSGALVISALLSWYTFVDVALLGNAQVVEVMRWIDVGSFQAKWALRIDTLTAVMLVLVTTVSSLVHIYSVGYMHHDPHVPRFMAYLSLFTFFMLMLVTSDNFIQLFLGWEGVGLCSYLLIGFWFKKQSANAAAMKAFLVNRVGDFGFALGIFAVYMIFDSVQFSEVFAAAAEKDSVMISWFGYEIHALTLIAFLLFIGAMGKSAQLGLHTWLPDAMEGPTPVSALIHAATMVTAGVFLVARCSPIYELAPAALTFITILGGCTAIFAASIAITQNDIKRVIAYSTCSQLGYMFFACGVSAYSAGVFHLLTHGFFKALLFLGAGSVIHAMANEQDLRYMGGVWKKIPKTYAMMWIGSLALVGVFPFAGFYSKDMILESAYAASSDAGYFAYWIGITAAFLTAFYSWRLIIMAFHGKPNAPEAVMKQVHESPTVMMLPLYILAVGAVAAGAIGYYALGIVDHEGAFWASSIYVLDENNPLEAAHHVPTIIKLMPLIVGGLGIWLAYVFYMFKPEIPGKIAGSVKSLYQFLHNKWYFDEIYDIVFVRGCKRLGLIFWQYLDVNIVDRLGPNGSAWASKQLATIVSKAQSGYVYSYAFVMLIGLLGLMTWYIIRFI